MNRIAGRTAVVTGAGNGLGRVIALELARQGARVVLVGRQQATLDAVAAEIAAEIAADTVVVPADTSDVGQVAALAEQVADLEVSILVNNAGIGGPVADLVDLDPADWDQVFDVNVRGVFLMCRALLPAMIAKGSGDVINIASVTGKRPLLQRTPYAASKMAVIGLTTTLAWEVGPAGVTVNSLSPGPVRGPRMERNFARTAQNTGVSVADAEAAFVSRAALGRMIEEQDVADAVVAMLHMPGLCGADIDLSAGMIGR